MPADAGHVSRFFEAHRLGFHLLSTPDIAFAICANEGDLAAVAALLRHALPPEELGPAATRALKAELEGELGEGFVDGILDHRAPFALDG